jgi:hypothetical protein
LLGALTPEICVRVESILVAVAEVQEYRDALAASALGG